jgi:hypothetical protein
MYAVHPYITAPYKMYAVQNVRSTAANFGRPASSISAAVARRSAIRVPSVFGHRRRAAQRRHSRARAGEFSERTTPSVANFTVIVYCT